MSNYYIKNGELMHYGVLGMKWGVRRYQNADGTLTAAGKRRYDRVDRKESDKKTALGRIDRQTNKINKRLDTRATAAKSIYDGDVSKAQKKYDAKTTQIREARTYWNAVGESKKEMASTRYDYAIAKRKAKADKQYKNSAEYKRIKSKYVKDLADRRTYGHEGAIKIKTLKQAGYTDMGAKFMTTISGQRLTVNQLKLGLDYDELEKRLGK